MSLDLPTGFVSEQTLKLGVGTTGAAPAKKVADQLAMSPLRASMQLHCDEGVRAAQQAKTPEIEKRYAEDPAFRAGYGYVWAMKNAPADAKQMLDDVSLREKRYEAAHVTIRG